MLFQGQQSQSVAAVRASGNPNVLQLQLGELGVSEVLPRYGALAWSGLCYYAANTAAVTLSVASGTFTGLAVANPANSGKNLMIIDAICALAAAIPGVTTPCIGYAATVALTTGSSTGPKGLPVLVGTSGASVANVGASATLGAAPTVLRPLIGGQWVTGTTGVGNFYAKDEVAGAIIIPPGQLICIQALVGALGVVGAITWAELPI